jgi:hypothetical protein
MRPPQTYVALENLGRVRLSKYFYMRNFLYSEIGNFYGRQNFPADPDLAIAAGRKLATELLDPLHETFGAVAVRSGYRSPTLNDFGANHVRPQKCAANEKNLAGHIWDNLDREGRMGACVSVAIPWFADGYEAGRDWRDLAWWLYDHLDFHEIWFFPKLAAFNLTWREAPEKRMLSYIAPKGFLRREGSVPREDLATRQQRYADFPPFRGIKMP